MSVWKELLNFKIGIVVIVYFVIIYFHYSEQIKIFFLVHLISKDFQNDDIYFHVFISLLAF